MRGLLSIVWLAGTLLLAGCITGVYRQASPLERAPLTARILLMPVDVELSELTAAGIAAPKADWTDEARAALTDAIRAEETARGATIVDFDPALLSPEERDEARQLQKLHAAVGAEILDHQYALLARLPTKHDGFAWTLGPARSARHALPHPHYSTTNCYIIIKDDTSMDAVVERPDKSSVWGSSASGFVSGRGNLVYRMLRWHAGLISM
jgi:hypothetical protein